MLRVFECVIKWVKHGLDHRKKFLPNLMEHVRLPLISKEYFSEKVVDEPLLNNNPKCKDYVFEAFRISLIKSTNPSSFPQTIWCKPRLHQQVILVLGWSDSAETSITNWYDPAINLMHIAPKMIQSRNEAGLCVVKDHFVFAIGGVYSYGYSDHSESSVEMLDVSSSSLCWVSKVSLLVGRKAFGVGVLYNCIYAIGGQDINSYSTTSSVEVFNLSTEQWKMVSNMAYCRSSFGVGVLNNLIYAVNNFIILTV
uniref:Ring canal kelch n=1 Tax=Schizaphis graminum TaxID=13262 RepID=A0A2S2NRN3_SCHGA